VVNILYICLASQIKNNDYHILEKESFSDSTNSPWCENSREEHLKVFQGRGYSKIDER